MEIWRTVESQPELEASSWGRIKRKPFQGPMPHGGLRWYISKPTYGCWAESSPLNGRMIYRYTGLRKTFKIGRLVCEAFHGPPPFPDAVAEHIDENPRNNVPENIRWGTQKENLNRPGFLEYCSSVARQKFASKS